jgi:hypothetical protein
MGRLIAPLRFFVIMGAIALAAALSACSSASTPQPGVSSSISAPAATKAASSANNPAAALPNIGGCNQNTRPQFVPDRSSQAYIPGGGPTILALEQAIDAQQLDRTAFDNGPIATPGTTETHGVICPDGSIYANGDPVAWTTKAWLVNNNPTGNRVFDMGRSRLYAHPANEVITTPCPAILQSFKSAADKKVFLDNGVIRAICLNNGATVEVHQ